MDEAWPVEGTPTSFYARHKAEVERRLDRFEQEHADRRVVRLRPGLIFKREAASGIRRLFAGPFLPSPLIKPSRIPLCRALPDCASRRCIPGTWGVPIAWPIVGDVRGVFNVAADTVLDPTTMAEAVGAKVVPLSAGAAHALASTSWHLRLQPTPPGWLDMALTVPLMDRRGFAQNRGGWEPRIGADQALRELLDGISKGNGAETPSLAPETSGPFRLAELRTRVAGSA